MRKYEIKKALEANDFETLKNLILTDFAADESKKYFYGHELTDYEVKNNRVSYATLCKCFDAILCNNITEADPSVFENVESGQFEYYHYNGTDYTEEELNDLKSEYKEKVLNIENDLKSVTDPEEELKKLNWCLIEIEEALLNPIYYDIFQYYIVSDNAKYLLEEANEILFYSEVLDCYIWGVTHYGTSWSMVLTSIKIDNSKE